MRTLLVIGSAPCLHEDVEKALNKRPTAELMLVNGACTAIEHVEHVLAGHTVKAELFAAARRAAFPKAWAWRLHANWARIGEAPKEQYPSVTDWWGGEVSCGATSTAKGAKIGLAMGFDEIVLCGSPMDGSGYIASEAKVKHDCQRIGDPNAQQRRIIKMYREKFVKLAANEFKGRVFSESGFTRECLGSI